MVKTEYFSDAYAEIPRTAMSEGQVSLRVENLACVRGLRVVFAELNFALAGGGVLHVSGANGAGKTSLLRMICGLLGPAAGTISLADGAASSLAEAAALAAQCHYLGHADGLKNTLTPRETIFYESRFLAPQSGDGARAGEDLLAFAGLLKQADQRIATLSAGQRRRLALTRLMAAPRRVWLLDEPYTALDGGGRELVDTLIRRQAEAGGLVILAAHEPVPLADHQLVLNA